MTTSSTDKPPRRNRSRRSWRPLLLIAAIGPVAGLLMGGSCGGGPTDPPPPTSTVCGLNSRDCEVALGTVPAAATVADLDDDGHLDVAVALFGGDSVAILINDGAGTFEVTDVIPTSTSPSAIAAADFNGDGLNDLAVNGTASIAGPAVSILINTGDALFATPDAFATNTVTRHITAVDIDHDGDMDIVTANEFTDSISVLLNEGDGTMGSPINAAAGDGPGWVAVADLDGDGLLDAVTANQDSDDISILIAVDDAQFAAPVSVPTGPTPRAVAAADFDDDGNLDLAVAHEGEFDDPVPDEVVILTNDGTGTFTPASPLPVGVNPRGIATGDLDDDGDVDVIVANGGTTVDTSTLGVLLNQGDGTFADVVNWLIGHGPESVALGDLDGDDDLDAVTANALSADVSLVANDGSGGFGAEP